MLTSIRNLILASAAAVPIAEGAFVPIDTFESYTVGNAVAGANGWTAGAGGADFKVVVDPTDSENQMLKRNAGGAHGVLLNDLATNAIAPGSTGTLYFRFLKPSTVPESGAANDFMAGLLNSGSTAADNKDLGYAGGVTAPNNRTTLQPYPNGNGAASFSADTGDTWYSLWVVYNNALNTGSDTFSVYVQGGTAYSSVTAIAENVVSSNQIADDLDTLKLAVWETRNNGFDDFYIDKSGANLSIATIPEPSSALLVGLAAAGLVVRRRR
ncbi:MAG TPA: PEP-CTERM sorting domain-containing protein [Chthoniobacteraceae bacterium]|jgi:hypothetical protein